MCKILLTVFGDLRSGHDFSKARQDIRGQIFIDLDTDENRRVVTNIESWLLLKCSILILL